VRDYYSVMHVVFACEIGRMVTTWDRWVFARYYNFLPHTYHTHASSMSTRMIYI